MRRSFVQESFFSVTPQVVFEFHERPDAFQILTPKEFSTEVHSTVSTLCPSSETASFTKRVFGIPFRFTMVHTVYEKPHLFVDEQLRGPFSMWRHRHQFIEGGWSKDPATLLRDEITYDHPLLFAGDFAVSRPLAKLFTKRHQVTRQYLAEIMKNIRTHEKKTVALTGGTGLIGGRITEILLERGDDVVLLSRDLKKARQRFGDRVKHVLYDLQNPEKGEWREEVSSVDAVIHLAGVPLFSKRWSPEFKRVMKESRTRSTHQLVDAIACRECKPKTFLCASAVGIYGMDPTIVADEESAHGDDLLADICEAWEEEARRAEDLGLRSAQLRLGIVLDTSSGALKEMLPLFKLGGGGVLGAPDRWINWVHLEDAARLFVMALDDDSLSGPLNVVAPHPVTNKTFAHTLGHVLRRPCLMRYPESLLKLAIGEAAKYAAGGPRVSSERAEERGYRFFYRDLEPALRSLLHKP